MFLVMNRKTTVILNRADYLDKLDRSRQSFHQHYVAMYSSVIGGIVTDPLLMTIPLDDHLVHRGDGVFEMFKCVDGGIYNVDAHLRRLAASAQAIGLALPQVVARLRETVGDTIRASGLRDCAIRVYVSRGPGSFGVNPYDCPASQLYIVVGKLSPSFMTLHPEGATVKRSSIPLKPGFFATMKHCNYLPNVLMKKEAVDSGVDFVAGFDADGHLAEGATENFGVVTRDGALRCPRLDHVLSGTTMVRVLELAEALVADGRLTNSGYGDLTVEDLQESREIMIFGTTTDVTRVRCFDGRVMPEDSPVFNALSQLLLHDIRHGVPPYRTPIE
jgi:branched-chain amino acid aminotransferase